MNIEERIAELRKNNLILVGLTRETNFFSINKESLSAEVLCWTIKEYSALSNAAIHLLTDSMVRVHDWEKLVAEVRENINEEMGLETKRVPHLEMMRIGYMKELGIVTDEVVPSDVTKSFLNHITKVFKHNDNAFQAGALLALEGSAIEEFHIVDQIVREYAKKSKFDFKEDWLTNLYIDGHKSFEIGHEQHLLDAILPYITEENYPKFELGYLIVAKLFSTWWQQLSLEIDTFQLNRKILNIVTEEPDIHKIFQTA